MADDWEQFAPVGGQQTDQTPTNWDQYQPAQESNGESADWDRFAKVDTQNDPRAPYGQSTQPSTSSLGVAAREFARGTLPALAGAIAGVGAGTLAAPSAPATFGLGPIAAGLGAGALAAGATRKLQNEVVDALGLDSEESRARDVGEHPNAALAGGLATAALAFQPGAIGSTIAQRGGVAAIMGGANAAQQYVETGEVHPGEVAANAAVGAILGKPQEFVETPALRGAMALGARPSSPWRPSTGYITPEVEAAIGGEKPPAARPPDAQPVVEGAQVPPPAETLQAATAAPMRPPTAEGFNIPPEGIDIGLGAPTKPMGTPGGRPTVRVPVRGTPPMRPPIPLKDLPFAEEAEPLEGEHAEITPRPPTQTPPEAAKAIETSQERGQPTLETVPADNEAVAVKPTEATPAEDATIAAMRPQPLSAGAAEGTKDFTPAQVAQSKSTLGDLWKKITRPWNSAFAPENLSEDTMRAKLNVAQAQGEGRRARLQGDKAREDFDNAVNALPGQYRDDAARQFQSGQIDPNNPISRVAGPLHAQEEGYQARLAKVDPDGNWQQNYLPYMFENPEAARDTIVDMRTPEGEGGRGITRPITVGDLMAEGHKLASDILDAKGNVNFPAMLNRLNTQRDKFLEGKRIAQLFYDDGIATPTAKTGFQELQGLTINGQKLYADPDVAMMWHRYFDPKAVDPSEKSFYDTALKIKNMGSAWQLLGGLYHLFAETGEVMNGDVMRAVSSATGGKFKDAGSRLAQSPFAPYRAAAKQATKALEAYYTPDKAAPRLRDTMDDLVRGGLTADRVKKYTPDLNTAGRNFWEAWAKAAARGDFGPAQREFSEKLARARQGPMQASQEVFRTLGEAMQTTMHPIFNVYIPRLKIAQAVQQLQDWKDANPNATAKQRSEIANRIIKSLDDRLGEMNQSTLFWNRTLQRIANLMFISPGWETGTVRGTIGGLTSLVKNPKSIAINSGMAYQPNAAFPLAFAITTMALGSIYQYIKTGQLPTSPQEALFPHTGGRHGTEQAILPGYLKDVYSWWKALAGHDTLPHSVANSLYNKLALVPHAAWDLMSNKNWADKQIVNPDKPVMNRLQKYLQYVHEEMMPIGYQQITRQEKGSNITRPEAVFGIKKAPSIYDATQKNLREEKAADRFRQKQQNKRQ